jgi:hypothetical protein
LRDASNSTYSPAATTQTSFSSQLARKCLAIVNAIGVWLSAQVPTFELHDLLPIGINIIRGAIVVGNDSTPTILIGDFKRADGTFGTTPVNICILFFVLLRH